VSAAEQAPPPPQRIPRPANARPGPRAPWASLPPGALAGIDLERVRAALAREVQPVVSVDLMPPVTPRQSAVLAPLFEEAGEARVLLTRRASTLRSHQSEVSFPGGQVDDGESLTAAALREAWEEVGIDPATVTIIGVLSPLVTFSSAALITPFVGALPGRPSVRVNAAEVARVFDVALADLLAPGVYHAERWAMGGAARDLHFFDLPGDIVWGATGRMLWELLVRVTSVASAA
jgi:8-oxo-dGTP pyrophosphatase MutT (NUDIX family)